MVSSMMATGAPFSLSRWSNYRPLSSGICNALKYPGSAQRARASGIPSPGFSGGCSLIVKSSSLPNPSPGRFEPSATARMPGMARNFSRRVSLKAFNFCGLPYFCAGRFKSRVRDVSAGGARGRLERCKSRLPSLHRYPNETSNLKSGFALKRDFHFCL